ncbi:hypothetical protein TSUD_54300 [Trifolium subterraneum]|uniref:Bidirectional sugar transporter SWEET n=1 Tax=Trifolium subterraneum TaxID=3900 RepID=A0A2Z6NQ73_TRISU|nr:hypothetical protein TSUD_54300 [Trifolium subterraneum]
MSVFASYAICKVAKDAAGIAGNIFAFGLFVSPIPTFRRIIRNGSTEMFSGLPYIYSLMNCLICMWYGTPLISNDNILVTTVNSIGAIFQFVYIIIFMMCAEKEKKRLVIQTKSVEFMPFYLSLSTFLMSTSFLIYGLLSDDIFIYLPNGIGTILGMVQLILFFYYEKKSRIDAGEPLIVSYA